jgi:hypothetical protein
MAEESEKNSKPKEEYKECPHCKGTTTCSCGSCIVFHKGPFSGLPIPMEGVCKVCNGTGRIPR